MYADDTQLYMDFRDSEENPAMASLRSYIQDIKSWLTYNILLLNDKESVMVKIGNHLSNEDI